MSQERCRCHSPMGGPYHLEASDALFLELRNAMLWHVTSPEALRAIRSDGFIRPLSPGDRNRWNGDRPYACQTLGAVCLFDFTSYSVQQVLSSVDRWGGFLVSCTPVTVAIGMNLNALPGRIVRYPENRDTTPKDSGGPIPWVEVCHVGLIPASAIAAYLLVCSVEHTRFERFSETMTQKELDKVTRAFDVIATSHAAHREAERTRFQQSIASPKFQQQLKEAEDFVRKFRKQS